VFDGAEVATKDKPKWLIIDDVLYGADAEMAEWINRRIGGALVEVPFVALGALDSNNKVVAGAYFFSHDDHRKGLDDVSDLYMAAATDGSTALSPTAVRRLLEYPFGDLKVRRLSAEIDMSNGHAIQQAEKLGFKLEGRKRKKGKGGGDVGIFGLLPEECPFWTLESPA
jgi:RimJ/RimL family protein N-acetyltransferase